MAGTSSDISRGRGGPFKEIFLGRPGKKFVVVLENQETSVFHREFLGELFKSCGTRWRVHVFIYVLNKESCPDNAFVYKFNMRIEEILEKMTENMDKEKDLEHVLVVDDFSLFSLLSANRDFDRIGRFLKICARKFYRSFVFGNQNTLDRNEICKLYDVATSVAILKESDNCLICDLLKLRNERKVVHEQTRFQLTEDGIQEAKMDFSSVTTKRRGEMLKNLTTFKLTLEDDEIETRNKLYLPYFDAQKIDVENPDIEDFDEEDEEV